VKVFAVLVLAGTLSVAALGQGQMQPPVAGPAGTPITRTIEGTVLDAHDSAVPHAVVLLKDTKTLQVRSYLAQDDGKYHFYGLSSDINYELRAQANGMTSPVKTVSVFDSHRVVTLDLKLKKKLKQ
jgi:Carboxypeptidase regulatory-like domain